MWLSGPTTPQHTDSHPCTRPPSIEARDSCLLDNFVIILSYPYWTPNYVIVAELLLVSLCFRSGGFLVENSSNFCFKYWDRFLLIFQACLLKCHQIIGRNLARWNCRCFSPVFVDVFPGYLFLSRQLFLNCLWFTKVFSDNFSKWSCLFSESRWHVFG